MILLRILLIVGLSLSAVGFFILKGRETKTERLGCIISIIGITCLIIGIFGSFAVSIIDTIRDISN